MAQFLNSFFWKDVWTSLIFVSIYFLSFSLEYSQHILKNPRGSLKQVVDNKNIFISYQPLNRQFRRKQLIGKLLWSIMRVFKRHKLLLL